MREELRGVTLTVFCPTYSLNEPAPNIPSRASRAVVPFAQRVREYNAPLRPMTRDSKAMIGPRVARLSLIFVLSNPQIQSITTSNASASSPQGFATTQCSPPTSHTHLDESSLLSPLLNILQNPRHLHVQYLVPPELDLMNILARLHDTYYVVWIHYDYSGYIDAIMYPDACDALTAARRASLAPPLTRPRAAGGRKRAATTDWCLGCRVRPRPLLLELAAAAVGPGFLSACCSVCARAYDE